MTGIGDEPRLLESVIVDVSAMSLVDLASAGDSALANSLRVLLADVERSAQTISGWTSYVD